jgi:hypothetical protein
MEHTENPVPQTVEVSSFMTRAANVFMSPGELYAEIAAAPVQSSSWVIPFIISLLVGVLMTVALFSNASLRDQALEGQREEIQKQVEEGKMTQEQADQAESMMSPTMFMVFGTVGVVFFVTGTMFLIPLLLFAVVKIAFKHAGNYKKILETYAIATLIGALGGIVALLMMYSMDSMLAQPSPAFFLRDSFERQNFVHNALASCNVFTIWEVAVVGLGLSKLTGRSTGAGMAVTFGLWVCWVLVSASFGWGAR